MDDAAGRLPDLPGLERQQPLPVVLEKEIGFAVEDLVEVRAPDGKEPLFPIVTPQWARRWPSEEIWKARTR